MAGHEKNKPERLRMDTETLTNILKSWVDEHLPVVMETGWYGDHITRIDGTSGAGSGAPDSVDVAIQGFNILMDYIGKREDIRLLLAIRLEYGKRTLKRNYPESKEELYRQWYSIEAPSLYMQHWKVFKYKSNWIEYSHPLPYLQDEFIHPVIPCYREWRSMDDSPHWEFNRDVMVQAL
jgi:hypothetical protein